MIGFGYYKSVVSVLVVYPTHITPSCGIYNLVKPTSKNLVLGGEGELRGGWKILKNNHAKRM